MGSRRLAGSVHTQLVATVDFLYRDPLTSVIVTQTISDARIAAKTGALIAYSRRSSASLAPLPTRTRVPPGRSICAATSIAALP